MPGLLIKNVPPEVHRRLKLAAQRSRRSMTSEALVLLENALLDEELHLIEPERWPLFRGRVPMTKALADRAKHTGRA